MAREKATPVMEQYLNLKAQYKDCLLFYRLGDFYELFFDDAVEVSGLLNIVLTKRGCLNGKEIPMCGVPVHSSESYLHKLINLGFKVAVCDQLETADDAKKRGHKSIVNRDVVRIVTPGTIVEDALLEDKNNNYLTSIVEQDGNYAIAWLELSIGKFFYSSTSLETLDRDLSRISPRELLISEKTIEESVISFVLQNYKISITRHAQSFFGYSRAHRTLCEFYKIKELSVIGGFNKAEIIACGALLEYIRVTQRGSIPRLEFPKTYKQQDFMLIDVAARRNLELFLTQYGEKKGSLISVIDYTLTAAGGRLLKQMLASPLICHKAINLRLSTVRFFVDDDELREKVREILSGIPDIERSLSRLMLGRGSPKDMNLLKIGLNKTLKLSKLLSKYMSDETELGIIYESLSSHDKLYDLLRKSILDNNVSNVKEGGFIDTKYSLELSELTYTWHNSNKLITKLRNSYRGLTGIAALKILYNNILGYYIEVPVHHKITLEEFVHRQGLANSTRYITHELKELENKILTARDAIVNLEIKIFNELCRNIAEESEKIALAANSLAKLDIRSAFAELAVKHRYTKPTIDESKEFNISHGRHPVIEVSNEFIPNSINLAGIHLITGPNMAGKSTFLRQNALIAILAHIGSFVPAESAHIGVIDKIFSRVGATDNIAAGYSTFMVEMMETATIVNQATESSLVILDEIGRGTGIYDGLSIAQAVVEYVHNVNRCRAVFATHYNELTKVREYLNHVKCFCMKVKEWKDKVIFLHEVIEGIADESYGIHVAKLAGFPEAVLTRAQEIFQELKAHTELNK